MKAHAQDTARFNHSVSIEYMQGFIHKHTQEVVHLITDQPTGFILSYDRHTYGTRDWESRYNYPESGITLYYADYGNPTIGKTIGLMPHYNFHFNKNRNQRSNFVFKMAFGLGYNTNPYHRSENNKNNFLGTRISFGTQLQARYDYQFSKRTSLQAGASIIHFSNATIRNPNKGINIVMGSIGLRYALTNNKMSYNKLQKDFEPKPILYSIGLSVGFSETKTLGSGSLPFYILHASAQKRIGHKSAFQLGTDFFITQSLKEAVKHDPFLEGKNPDYKRVGIFTGHEWYINKLSLVTQFGYYVYRPYDSFKPVYQRVKLKYYLKENLSASFALKTHFAKAEAAEFGIGIRL